MGLTIDTATAAAKDLAEVCTADIDPKEVARDWRLEFASWSDGELLTAIDRWKVANADEMLPSFPKAKDLRVFRPDSTKDTQALNDKRLKCICDGDGMTTWRADNGIGAQAPGHAGDRVMSGPAGETVVIPCYYCNRVRFDVWYHSVTNELWNSNVAPEWASTARPEAA